MKDNNVIGDPESKAAVENQEEPTEPSAEESEKVIRSDESYQETTNDNTAGDEYGKSLK